MKDSTTFTDETELVIGTLVVDKDNRGYMHYNFCYSNSQVTAEKNNKEIYEIVDKAEAFCKSKGYLLYMY